MSSRRQASNGILAKCATKREERDVSLRTVLRASDESLIFFALFAFLCAHCGHIVLRLAFTRASIKALYGQFVERYSREEREEAQRAQRFFYNGYQNDCTSIIDAALFAGKQYDVS